MCAWGLHDDLDDLRRTNEILGTQLALARKKIREILKWDSENRLLPPDLVSGLNNIIESTWKIIEGFSGEEELLADDSDEE